MARAERVAANGLEHLVRVWEGPRDRTVFALHGYLDQSASLIAVCDRLAASGRRVIAPDFRGHGETEWVPRGAYYHFADYVADLAALVDAFAPAADGPIALVAHSMGGTVATHYAGSMPERVSALALLEGIGPPPMPPEIAPDRSRRWLEALARPNVRESRRLASVAEAVERLRATHGGSVPSAVLERVATESTMPHPSGEGRIWRFDPLHQTTSPGRFDADAFEQYAARIRAPVLIVDGGENGMRLPGTDHRAGAYRNVARARIDGAGHMMHWTRPDETADAVIAFLEGVARRLAG